MREQGKKTGAGKTARRAIPGVLLAMLVMLACPVAGLATPAGQQAAATAESRPAPQVQPMPQTQQLRPEAAFALMAGEAEKGNGAAMLALGRFYEQGIGIARNYGKALEWYTRAAGAGQAEGHYNVGVCFEIGMGTANDVGKAIQSYQKAADLGLALAMYKLASLHIAGTGTPKDPARAIAWLDKAAGAGMAVAANELGLIYLSGLLGQKKDEKKALAMFTRAADLGNLEAIKNIAVIHKDGLGVKADPARAYTWYLVARKGGYAGEDIARVLGLLEASLSAAQIRQAQKEADDWMENYGRLQAGAP